MLWGSWEDLCPELDLLGCAVCSWTIPQSLCSASFTWRLLGPASEEGLRALRRRWSTF